MEPDRVSDLIAFLHVADVERSIAFYEKLGLAVDDTREPDGQLVCLDDVGVGCPDAGQGARANRAEWGPLLRRMS
jgi:catechol 2,3-dioxygenase-like lactoylglutathione lyase family enzyme